MGDALLLEMFLAFSQLCHMVYLQVGNFDSRFFFNSKFLQFFGQKNYIPVYFAVNIAVLLKKFSGEEGEKADVQKLFGYIGLFTLVALWWLGKCCRIVRLLTHHAEGHAGFFVLSFSTSKFDLVLLLRPLDASCFAIKLCV